jgi:hypothetical protein
VYHKKLTSYKRINAKRKPKKKQRKRKKMPVPIQQLQCEASALFRYREEDWQIWGDYTFVKVLDHNNVMNVDGIGLVHKLEEIKETLDEMKEELENDNVQYMENEEGEPCKIFDMGENIIMENKWWLYDYEIEEYYEMIEEKVMEYYVLVKEIEDEKNKIQMEKDVCLGVTLALLRC